MYKVSKSGRGVIDLKKKEKANCIKYRYITEHTHIKIKKVFKEQQKCQSF